MLGAARDDDRDSIRGYLQEPPCALPAGPLLNPASNDAAGGPEQIWFDIDAPSRRSSAHLNARPRLAERLALAASVAERTAIVGSLLDLLGFRTFAYVAIEQHGDTLARIFLSKAHLPAQYRGLYFAERHDRIDPRMSRALSNGGVPIVWDIAGLRGSNATQHADPAALRRFLNELAADEMRSGFMVAFPTSRRGLRAVVSLTSARQGSDWIGDDVFGQAMTIALGLHRFVSPHLMHAAQQRDHDVPTGIQASVLDCVAMGMSDKQISARLGMTLHAIDYHMRALRQKYGVSNRTQLAFAAGRQRST